MIENKDEILAAYDEILSRFDSTDALEQQIRTGKAEASESYGRIQEAIDENARIAQDQDEYNRRYDAMNEQYGQMMKKLSALKAKLIEQRARISALKNCMASLRAMDGLIEAFDEKLFASLVDQVIVGRSGTLKFVFNDGSER